MLNRLKPYGGAAFGALTAIARHRRVPSALCGAAIGTAAWCAAHPFVAAFGFNRDTHAALLLTAAACFALGCRAYRGRSSAGLTTLFAAAWLVLLPAVLAVGESLVAAVPVAGLDRAWVRLPMLFLAAGLVFGFPAFAAGRAVGRRAARGEGVTVLLSAACGIGAAAFVAGPWFGLQVPLLVVAVGIAAAWFTELARGREETPPANLPASGEAFDVRTALTGLVGGAACGVCGRVLAQLNPEAVYLIAAGACGLLGGGAAGAVLARRLRPDAARRLAAGLAAVTLLAPLAAFPWLVGRHLDAAAFVSSVFWLAAARAATVLAVFLPLGAAGGLTAGRGARAGTLAGAAAFGLVGSAWLIPAVGVPTLALAGAAGLLLIHVAPLRSAVPGTRRGWAAAAVCGAGLVAAGVNAGGYQPARSARLLFSTESFVAHQRRVPTELLPYLDDSRLAAVRETAQGTVTVWKQRGDAVVVRRNGVPVAATSARPDRCPLPTPDVLRVALPLVLHPAPESLLVLGDPLGLATDTAVAFPLREITCYGPAVADATAAPADDRVTRRAVEPRLAVAADGRAFDVVVSDPGPLPLPAAGPYLTREFYARAAGRLAPAGVFCQRLRYADFGADPLRVVAASIRGLFGEAFVVEAGPGEYLLVATTPGEALVREGLVERLRRPQVRATLATFGWDWCVPLNLAAVEGRGLDKLASEAVLENTGFNAALAYRLPLEMMRWGSKGAELQRATAGMTTRLLDRGVAEADQRDVLDRIAEVTGQHRLMTEYPDQPWAYRKEVRTKLKETPRSVIQTVAGEVDRDLHPDDRRRVDYFAALGAAAKEPGAETLAGLERFAAPYDPLLSYFLHHEIAPLYAKLGAEGDAAQAAHRLYAAHFSDPRDRSVRNEVAALELIAANPGLFPDAAERFDQLNGLIEVLLGRWEARGTAPPKSPEVVMVDIDKTLDAADAAVAAMGPIAGAAGLTDEQWRLRKAAIERTLTRPLRSYRTTLLPHLRAARREAETKSAEARPTSAG